MKNDATQTTNSTIASTVSAVGNLNRFCSGPDSAAPVSTLLVSSSWTSSVTAGSFRHLSHEPRSLAVSRRSWAHCPSASRSRRRPCTALSTATTAGASQDSPITTPHCPPDSDVVSRMRWNMFSSIAAQVNSHPRTIQPR